MSPRVLRGSYNVVLTTCNLWLSMRVFRKRLSVRVSACFPFGFDGRILPVVSGIILWYM